MSHAEIQNFPGEGTQITGSPSIIDNVDVTSRIHYDISGRASEVESFCLVNRNHLSFFRTRITPKGSYREEFMDEYHAMSDSREVPRSKLEEHDKVNSGSIPLLRVLGKTREEVEKVLQENNNSAYHIGSHLARAS